MNFDAAIYFCLTRYAQFDGRAGRAEYWWFQLFLLLIFIAVVCLSMLSTTLGGFAMLLAAGGLMLPNLAVTVRRMHDVGWSGWWLLAMFVPFGSMALLAILLWPGNRGANRFGATSGWIPPEEMAALYEDYATLRQTRIPVVRRRR